MSDRVMPWWILAAASGTTVYPLPVLVGRAGQVYAIDKDRKSLNRLAMKAQRLGLTNVHIIEGCDRPRIYVFVTT